MPIEIRVEDASLVGFSDPAINSVKRAGEEFITHLIAEANRIESGQNTGGGPVEITKPMVDNATLIQRHAIGGKKAPMGVKLLRIASVALSLIVGFMYDEVKLQNTLYMAAFVGVMTVALGTTILSTLRE